MFHSYSKIKKRDEKENARKTKKTQIEQRKKNKKIYNV